MNGEQTNKGVVERSAGFLKRLNYAIGAVAVAGAAAFESAVLAAFAVLQFAEGALWSWLEKRRAHKQKPQVTKIPTFGRVRRWQPLAT